MSDDLIRREDALDAVKQHWHLIDIVVAIKALPSVQPERKKGKWIEQEDGWGGYYYDCSVCKESWTTIDGTPWDNGMNYCPNCGAEMEV